MYRAAINVGTSTSKFDKVRDLSNASTGRHANLAASRSKLAASRSRKRRAAQGTRGRRGLIPARKTLACQVGQVTAPLIVLRFALPAGQECSCGGQRLRRMTEVHHQAKPRVHARRRAWTTMVAAYPAPTLTGLRLHLNLDGLVNRVYCEADRFRLEAACQLDQFLRGRLIKVGFHELPKVRPERAQVAITCPRYGRGGVRRLCRRRAGDDMASGSGSSGLRLRWPEGVWPGVEVSGRQEQSRGWQALLRILAAAPRLRTLLHRLRPRQSCCPPGARVTHAIRRAERAATAS